ncbi:MAG TPA: hypothetical protein VFW11_13465 [Cyclobacteriaceae bacterium]|nr:hypothetical protein [Cyclobacteriaceae bacterium]
MKRPSPIRRWLVTLALFSLLVLFLLFVGGILLSRRYSTIIEKQIQENLAPGIKLDFESCKINLLARTIIFRRLEVHVRPDSVSDQHHIFKARDVTLSGIHVLPFLINRKLHINRVVCQSTDLTIERSLLRDSLVTDSRRKNNFAGAEIDYLKIDDLRLSLRKDTLIELRCRMNISARKIVIPEKNDVGQSHFQFTLDESSADEIFYSPDGALYNLAIKRINLDERTNLVLDSIRIDPKFGKVEFARKVGKQIDRFDSVIPKVKINNLHAYPITDSTINASGIHIYSPVLNVFRDNRLPFIKEHEVPLPVNILKRIPWTLSADTVQVHQADITYEEFPADGDSSGRVTFNDLQASVFNFTNEDATGIDHIDLDVKTKFMNSGLLAVSFDLPLQDKATYTARGALLNFNLVTINSMTEPLAKMRIESGVVKQMEFHFDYDEYSSAGEVEINYNNLKILSLTEKESKTVIDKFKTFLLNVFVIPKKKDEATPVEKRKGEIEFKRDPKRSIFNYWWKSLFTGIKSSYGLEMKNNKE